MKKIFAIIITILILVPCFSIFTSAEASVDIITVSDCSSNVGWEGLDENTEIVTGETILAKTFTKPIYATWGYPDGKTKDDFQQILFNYVFPEAKDISNMTYLTFELYATDKAVFDHRFVLELTSSGEKDKEENNLGKALTEYVTDLGENWYRVEIPIADLKGQVNGGLDNTKCNYMRLYYDDGFGTAFTYEGSFVFGVRSVRFTKERATSLEDAAKVDAIVKLFDPIASIKAEDINAENYETIKEQIAAAKQAYQAADEFVQEGVRAKHNVISIISTIGTGIRKYEEALNAATTDTSSDETVPNDGTETTAEDTEPTEKSGCGSTIALGVLPVVLLGVVGFIYRKEN